MTPRIIIENRIPFIKGLLEPVAQVTYLPANEITRQAVSNAHALVVRTRTRCDAQLLQGSQVHFIGSATIGTDHIDLDYCRQAGITVASAPGCNAPAVAQWTLASMALWLKKNHMNPAEATLGVVGVGHVGSIVARWAEQCGMRVLRNDPPRALTEGSDGFSTIKEIQQQCHIITFHTPLTREGDFPTWHLCDRHFLDNARQCRLVLNCPWRRARHRRKCRPRSCHRHSGAARLERRPRARLLGKRAAHPPCPAPQGLHCHTAHCRILQPGQDARHCHGN